MNKIIMRTEYMKKGLLDMIDYIDAIGSTKNMLMVEVGVFEGDASVIFAQRFKTVWCVDPWTAEDMNVAGADPEGSYKTFCEKTAGYKNIKTLRATSEAASRAILSCACQDGSLPLIDIVYIDAKHDKESVKQDIDLWLPLVAPGGFVSGHDYNVKFQGVIEAVNEKLGVPDEIFRDGSWIKRV